MQAHKAPKDRQPLGAGSAKSASLRKMLAIVVVCLIVLGLLSLLFETESKPSSDAASSSAPGKPSVDQPAYGASEVASKTKPGNSSSLAANQRQPAPTSAVPPRGLTAEQWQILNEKLSGHPRRDEEIKRVLDFMAFGDDLNQLEELVKSGNARHPRAFELAKDITAGLPSRLQQREIMLGEAIAIKAMALDVLEPDPFKRQASLKDFQKNQVAELATPADPRDVEFLQQKDKLVAAWQAQPETSRNPDKFQSDVEALRLRIYAASAGKQ